MKRTSVVLASLCGIACAACGPQSQSTSHSASAESTTLTVLAASSLTEAFTRIADDFEKVHPEITVDLSFGASSSLAASVVNGAPADVFAAASPTTMATVVDAHDAAEPTVFAKNVMEVVVPVGNPAHITGISDLARKGVTVALCQADVPCGVTAAKALAAAGVHVTAATQEVDVKAVLTKVRLGEVDAGIVYVTDVRAGGRAVTGIPIPPAQNATTSYPIAVLSHSAHRAQAQQFLDYVTSATGRQPLTEAGFLNP